MTSKYDALEALAKKTIAWRLDDAIPSEQEGVWLVGSMDDDGVLAEVVGIDTGNYDQPDDAEHIAKFYAAANGVAVLGLIADVKALAEALTKIDEAASNDAACEADSPTWQAIQSARSALARIQGEAE